MSLRTLRGDLHLENQASHLGQIVLQPSRIDLEAHGQRLHIQRFDLDTSVARMTATGMLDLDGASDLQYTLSATLDDLQAFLGVTPCAGEVHVAGQVQGAWPDLQVHGTLNLHQVHYQQYGLSSLQLTYSGAQLGAAAQLTTHLLARQLQLGPLLVEQVTVDATYENARQQVRFAVEVTSGSDYGGKTSGTLTRQATAYQLILDDFLVRLAAQTWQAAAPVQLELAPQRLAVQPVHLVHDAAALILSGTLDRGALQAVHLQATQVDLALLQPLLPKGAAISGHATGQLQLTGTLAAPRWQGELTLRAPKARSEPFEQIQAVLTYDQQQLQSQLRLWQRRRQVLSLDLRLPLDLALTPVPLAERLLEAPLEADLRLDRPRLAAFQAWFPALASLSGTLQGSLEVQGHYHALRLNTNLDLQQVALANSVQQLNAPIRLSATLDTAPALPELVQALQNRQLRPQLRAVTLQVPKLNGQFSLQGDTERPFWLRDVQMRASAQWRSEGVQITVQSLRAQGRAAGLPVAEVDLAARWQRRRLDVTRVRIRLPQQSDIQGQGYILFPGGVLKAHLDMPHVQLGALPWTLPPGWPAVMQGALSLQGTLQAPEIAAQVQYAGAQLQATVAAHWREQPWRYEATARLEGLEAARLFPGARGQMDATLQVQGHSLSTPQRQATLSLDLDTRGLTLLPGLTAHLQAEVSGQVVQVQRFQLHSVPVALVASGKVTATREVDLTYTCTARDLTALRRHLGGVDAQAQGQLSGQLKGTLTALHTQGQVQIDTWRYGAVRGQAVHGTYAVSPAAAGPQARVGLQFANVQGPTLPSSTLQVTGTYAFPQGTVSAAVTSGPYQYTRLTGTLALQPEPRLTLQHVHLQHDTLAWHNVAPIEIERHASGLWSLNPVQLRSQDQEIRAQGALTPDGILQAQAHLQRLQLQPTLQALFPDAEAPDGELALDLTVHGTLAQPQAHVNLRLTALRWQQQDLGDMYATGTLQDHAWQASVRWSLQDHDLLQGQGTGRLGATGVLDAHLQATDIDLQLLAPLLNEVSDSAGRLRLDLHLAGAVRQPRVRGSLVITDGALQLVTTGERYRDIAARLQVHDDRIDIEQCEMHTRTGALVVTGSMTAITHNPHLDLSVQAQEFTAIRTATLEAVVSSDVTLRGTPQDLLVAGHITVSRARIFIDDLFSKRPQDVKPWELTVQGVYGPRPATYTPASPALLPQRRMELFAFMRTDVQVHISQNTWIEDSGVAVEVRGDLHGTKALNEPLLVSGTVQAERGFVSFYGKKFNVTGGQVTFRGTPELNPWLDVNAMYDVASYLVKVQITGQTQQPHLTISSTPDLPQVDIVSLLLTGKTVDRLTTAERTVLSNQTRQIADDALASQLEKGVGASLGLDTIEVTAGSKLGTGSISVGRYVTQDLFLSYERQIGQENNRNTVEVEYSINTRLKLQGSSSDSGEASLDLLWRLDY
jgi:autotransporter translocation and assembly factor TamB